MLYKRYDITEVVFRFFMTYALGDSIRCCHIIGYIYQQKMLSLRILKVQVTQFF